MRKADHHTITGTIVLLSPTRIGGSDDVLEIGGTDLSCIKDVATGKPYIPGSSLKGKLRSELEQRLGLSDGSEPFTCKKRNPSTGKWESMRRSDLHPEQYLLATIFGPHKNTEHDLGPTRIIVRDAPCAGEFHIERKASTAIDRKTGAALRGALRTEERVAAGAEFVLKIGIQVWDIDRESRNCAHNAKTGDEALIEFIKDGLRAVQQTGLGSGVSKGSGEIEFRDLKLDGQPFQL